MIRQFFAYYRPYMGLFYLDFGCAVIVGVLELGFPLAINQFVDNLLPTKNWPLIILATVILLAIYALNTGLQYVVNYWGHMLGINIETDMRTKLFDHIQKLSFRYFDNKKTGHLIARITTDLQDIGELAPPRTGRPLYCRYDADWRLCPDGDDSLGVGAIDLFCGPHHSVGRHVL